ncbi:hypothetical protein BLS_001742 [Venturia inaequalis]|uniref:Translation initiation factor eIF4e n=1 Tax=Venturia inaequalis TaxID=5025 RepID=A0A8H3Z891_VENIN|nr:hypothetical protein BLS_001742 [Venturia inaequalis]KAE9984087.1 hypothetical protein EG328_009137 [Venturia inaequalis]RDI87910.1 hypothetical protein Vi05172_g2108 [Venturia inaequalis]
MAQPSSLRTNNLPSMSDADAAATNSPARGRAMVAALSSRLRKMYPLVHSWEFWHDRSNREKPADSNTPISPSSTKPEDTTYEERLVKLLDITDVQHFWELYNNFPVEKMLRLRDSVHLFKKGVKPLWEDPRNLKGGAWTFRVPKELAPEFWKHLCLAAIGESLQAAVYDETKKTFRDDICGVSYSVRFNSMLIQIWNRDGDHEAGKQRILETVLREIPDELIPKRPDLYYYKKHSSHAGFTASIPSADVTAASPIAAS